MSKLLFSLFCIITFFSCNKDDVNSAKFTITTISLPTHKLTSYSIIKNTKYLIVFESGLGNDHSIWNQRNMPTTISTKQDVLLYDRAGYGTSTIDNNPRYIERIVQELDSLINNFANGRKVIFVAHSFGGLIIRDFTIKHPSKVAGLLFIDSSHELYNLPLSQEKEDILYNSLLSSFGPNHGATREARELNESLLYMSTTQNLPDIPVIVLTSMKLDSDNINADNFNGKTRQDWYNAHNSLGIGITDFIHVTTINSGHYIFIEEPNLVLENLNLLISKLP